MSVGASLPHDAALMHVTGRARYVDDIPTPEGTLHIAFGLSEHAHANLAAIDLAAVRSAPDVVLALSGDDLDEIPDCSPSIGDEPLLADGTVHYLGQPIFLVAATSHLAARKAARLGAIAYARKTPILSYEDALSADSRFEDGPRIYSRGDAQDAIAAAPLSVEGEIAMGGQEHFYLEGQACLAVPGEDEDMLIHASTQHPTEIQHKVAHALHVPMHAVRVETRRMGGGFGGKESQGNALAIATALVAARTGKPCKMRYDRDDDMMITGKRHDFRVSYRCGFDETGKILGLDVMQLTRAGWAQDLTLPVADRAMLHADNAYMIANMRVESHRLRTNSQSATAFRGFGGPQGVLGMERIIDHIAHRLGRDPTEVRAANYYADVDEGGPEQTTHYGMPVQDGVLHAMSAKVLASSDYAARRTQITAWNAKNATIKKGLALSPVKFGISFTLTHLNQAGALVHVYQDGSIALNHGGTEMGQGLFQKVAQVAAASFGVPVSRVKITATDTAKVPNTSATAASSGTDLNGMAVLNACTAIRERIEDHLRTEKGAKTIRWENDHVIVDGVETPFETVIQHAYEARISLSATGFYKTPDISWDRIKGEGRPFFYFAYGMAVTEVALDTLTGEYRLLRADILHDAGNSLNPALDIGQVEGGYIQGAGWLTTEELVWDEAGRLRTHAPSTYKIPTARDAPEVFNVALWDGENPMKTIYRSKAVGEPPFILGISAFLALSDAVAACGPHYPALDAPATPEECLRAIKRAQGEPQGDTP